MEQLVTQAEYARHRRVSREAVSKAVKTGKLAGALRDDPKRPGRKLLDLAAADLALGANVERILADLAADDGSEDFGGAPAEKLPASATAGLTAARTRREEHAATMAELELNRRLGNLRPVEEFTIATQRCAEIAIRSIDRITGRADELAAQVTKDGVIGARTALRAIARELRGTMAEAFGKLAAGDIRGDDEADAEAAEGDA